MIQSLEKNITLAEFLAQPETKPAREYINGNILSKPMPQGKHSQLQGKLVTTINQVTTAAKVALAFPELRCTFGERSLVPDLAIFAWQRIPTDADGDIANVFPLAPDWAIEILSPGQSQTKVTGNLLHCLRHGTQMGWLIDPAEKSVFIYTPDNIPTLLQNQADVLPVPPLASPLTLTVGDVFGWLKL